MSHGIQLTFSDAPVGITKPKFRPTSGAFDENRFRLLDELSYIDPYESLWIRLMLNAGWWYIADFGIFGLTFTWFHKISGRVMRSGFGVGWGGDELEEAYDKHETPDSTPIIDTYIPQYELYFQNYLTGWYPKCYIDFSFSVAMRYQVFSRCVNI